VASASDVVSGVVPASCSSVKGLPTSVVESARNEDDGRAVLAPSS
jgi:hypothetical protein